MLPKTRIYRPGQTLFYYQYLFLLDIYFRANFIHYVNERLTSFHPSTDTCTFVNSIVRWLKGNNMFSNPVKSQYMSLGHDECRKYISEYNREAKIDKNRA